MEEKVIDILQKAATLFTRLGIKSVTMDDIARELVISKKTLYKYFKDKNDLVLQIIASRLDLNHDECNLAAVESENAIDELFKINKMIRQQFASIHPSVFYDLQKYHQDAWQLVNTFQTNFIRSRVEENIVRGIEEKLYRENTNLKISAQFYLTIITSIISGDIFKDINFTYETLFKELMRSHVRSIATPEGITYLIDRIKDEENK